MDTALVKLLTQKSSPHLLSLLQSTDLMCDVDDCSLTMERAGRLHARALLLRRSGRQDAALSIWAELLRQTKTDPDFPGLEFFVTSLVGWVT